MVYVTLFEKYVRHIAASVHRIDFSLIDMTYISIACMHASIDIDVCSHRSTVWMYLSMADYQTYENFQEIYEEHLILDLYVYYFGFCFVVGGRREQ